MRHLHCCGMRLEMIVDPSREDGRFHGHRPRPGKRVQQRSFAYLDDEEFRTDPRLVYIPAEVQKSWDPQTDFRMKWHTPEDWRRAKQIYDKSFDMAREI